MKTSCLVLWLIPGMLLAEAAPENLPRLTVRWEDPEQRDVFVVEGEQYECRVGTIPARIVSLRWDGRELLGPGGMVPEYVDENENVLSPPPEDVIPPFQQFGVQKPGPHPKWHPSLTSRARFNVWRAGPDYWQAWVNEIPFVATEKIPSEPRETRWDFRKEAGPWKTGPGVVVRGPDPAHGWHLRTEKGPILLEADGLDLQPPGRLELFFRGEPIDQPFEAAWQYWGENNPPADRSMKIDSWRAAPGDLRRVAWSFSGTGVLEKLRLKLGTEGTGWQLVSLRWRPGEKEEPVVPIGRIALHAHPDHLRVQLLAGMQTNSREPGEWRWKVDAPGSSFSRLKDHPSVMLGPVAVLGPSGGKMEADRWAAPGNTREAWIFRPAGKNPEDAFQADLNPLGSRDVKLSGAVWKGWDPATGLYVVEPTYAAKDFSFQENYDHPDRIISTDLEIRNRGPNPGHFPIHSRTGIGSTEAGLLTDAAGFPLPNPVFVSKNFGGEMEEPDDAAYGDMVTAVQVPAQGTFRGQLHQLFQNWGSRPIKQVSFIRFFIPYWHLSTGVQETTCFNLPWMAWPGAVLSIPDFRPMNGPMMKGQPNHECVQLPGFLTYDENRVRPSHERTIFESISPKLTRFTMLFRSTDGAARIRAEVTEIPQQDQMRTFVKLRYDWDKTVEIPGDARMDLRLLNIHERLRFKKLLWTGSDGEVSEAEVKDGPSFVLGAPVGGDVPWLQSEPLWEAPFGEKENPKVRIAAVVLLRDFQAKLGGQEIRNPTVTGKVGPRGVNWWLTTPQEKLRIQSGDFAEMDLMLMPYGEPAPEGDLARQERERYALGRPRVAAVKLGKKERDFPARLRAEGETCAFSLEGGAVVAPVTVRGFAGRLLPLLWKDGKWAGGGTDWRREYQVDGDGADGYRFTFLLPVENGKSEGYLVTRASCSEAVTRVREENGKLVLEAEKPGRWKLKAPVKFSPGTNREIAPGLFEFEGEGKEIRGG